MKIPVLLPNIFNYPFTYESANLKLNIGDYVIVPFGIRLYDANLFKKLIIFLFNGVILIFFITFLTE